MEKIDPGLQQRVWQRVQGPGQMTQSRENPKAWLLLTQENDAGYRQLARELGGRYRETFASLARGNRKSMLCIRGLCRLRGESGKPGPVPPKKEQPRRMLEGCLRREKRLWEEAERCGSDPEYGCVYSAIASQAGERCVRLLELLGQWEEN